MDKFNIAEYISIVKKGFVKNCGQGPAGIAVLECIGQLLAEPIYFDDTIISRLCKHTTDCKNEMVTAVSNPNFQLDVIQQFKDYVEEDFNSTTIASVCLRMMKLIDSEPNLADCDKNRIRVAYSSDDYSTFLALALIYCIGMSNTNERKEKPSTDEIPYLNEANSHCPKCGKYLFKKLRTGYNCHFEVTKIFDSSFDEDTKKELDTIYPAPTLDESTSNKIILCEECYSDYRAEPTPDFYKFLYEKKRELETNYSIEESLKGLDVEEELSTIVNDLGTLTENKLSKVIPLEPKEVSQKIKDDVVLKDDVTKWVLRYYKYIESLFSDLDSNGRSRFKVIASEVSTAFERLDSRGDLSQSEIFNQLAKWLYDSLGYTKTNQLSLMNIIVAFFVQNCEVFHEISE